MDKKIRRTPKLPWQQMDGRILVLQPQESMAHELNPTAACVWRALAQDLTISQMVEQVCAEFEVDEVTARPDIESCVATLAEKGLVQWL